MIRKIMVFSDYYDGANSFVKTGANLRITYMLRSLGYEVLPVHHCLSFTADEIDTLIDRFSGGDQICICISTSFLMTRLTKNLKYVKNTETDALAVEEGEWWGDQTFGFLMSTCSRAKQRGHKVVLGGWGVEPRRFRFPDLRHAWGIDALSNYVDCWSIGNNVDLIHAICLGQSFEHEMFHNSIVAHSSKIQDFSDCASTPLPSDLINPGESLVTELAAGCIFSCSFCDYGTLGKKKTEYMRTYDSLKRELLSNWENFQTRVYTFSDNIVNDNDVKLRWLIRFREETGIDLRWVGYVRLDTIKSEVQARLIADSGIAGCVFGIESFKPEVGRYIGKMTDKARLVPQLEMFRHAVGDRCLTLGAFITGLPTETKLDVYKTYEWLKSEHGRDLIDSYTFTALLLFEGQDEKNDINRSRNHPFKDYTRRKMADWSSPWGTYSEFSDLARHFNDTRPHVLGGFTPALVHNIGIDIEHVVRAGRTNPNIPKAVLIKGSKIKIEAYRRAILGIDIDHSGAGQ